jgi:hypothetical protein
LENTVNTSIFKTPMLYYKYFKKVSILLRSLGGVQQTTREHSTVAPMQCDPWLLQLRLVFKGNDHNTLKWTQIHWNYSFGIIQKMEGIIVIFTNKNSWRTSRSLAKTVDMFSEQCLGALEKTLEVAEHPLRVWIDHTKKSNVYVYKIHTCMISVLSRIVNCP